MVLLAAATGGGRRMVEFFLLLLKEVENLKTISELTNDSGAVKAGVPAQMILKYSDSKL